MTDKEILEALLAGKVVRNEMNIFLRLNPETGGLESRAVPHDPDWTTRHVFNEMRGFMGNPDIIARGQYSAVVDDDDLKGLSDEETW